MENMRFEFSDTIAGYVTGFNREKGIFGLKTSDGREFSVKLGSNLFARLLRNLGEPYSDCTGQVPEMLVPDQYLFAYGIFYPQNGSYAFEAQALDFPGKSPGEYRFEEPDWWPNQARSIADFFINAQFGGPEDIDYHNYRTSLKLTGEKVGDARQETDTISRLVYGFASAFLLTGEDRFLEAAEKGTAYLRDHSRLKIDDKTVCWYHGIDVNSKGDHKLLGSEFGDDYHAVPMYEQIYALAGPTQTYRANGDPAIMGDIRKTMNFFDRFLDAKREGYFSHVDPYSHDPRSENLGHNRARKNWNSVGDHAPAYLINLWLASGDPDDEKFLVYTADCIEKYFQDYDNSPFVNEKFFEDWSFDQEWGWQQNQAVVGHNLKIAWNLMRINSLAPSERYVEFAKNIAELMPQFGMDKQRGGWYDVVARTLGEGEEMYRFAWHDRKAWWQQEQGILAYQILYGVLKDKEYLKYARESAAFYNTFFLDHDDGAIYFNVLANGTPYLLGTERMKGSHSMSGYHSIELAYLAAVYTKLLNTKQPLDLYFRPVINGFENKTLRVQPDILTPGSVRVSDVWIDDVPWKKFDAEKFTIELPNLDYRPKIKVRLVPSD